jgi:glycine betaine/proline transport system permease protein
MDIKKNKKLFFNIGLLVFFVWLLIISYSSSKRKPDNVGELLNDFSWLQKWPKWLDLPLMKWINVGFKKLNETYGFIFEAINDFLLAMLMALKNFLILAPWPAVVLGVTVIAYFASGRKIRTTVFVGFCTFFIGFLHPIFWQKAIETTAIMLISIFLCLIFGMPGNEAASVEGGTVYVVSMDLPFAAKRFCSTEGIENLAVLTIIFDVFLSSALLR